VVSYTKTEVGGRSFDVRCLLTHYAGDVSQFGIKICGIHFPRSEYSNDMFRQY
jgi:hypothetical protein